MRWKETGSAHKLHKSLVLRGFAVSRTVSHCDRKPYCDDPVLVGLRASSSREFHSVEASMYAPCRKCAKCLQFRQARWRQRAAFEIANAKRTWMITLTFSPVHLAGCLVAAKDGSVKAVEASCYRQVQLFLKRLRKVVPRAKLRYLAIYERGETTGRSHYHLLLHEVGERPVTKAALEAQWASFVHARLVSSVGAGTYVTKYLTKSIDIRPRASYGYGSEVGVRQNTQPPNRVANNPTKGDHDAPPPQNLFTMVGVGSDFEKGVTNGGQLTFSLANRARSAEFFEPASTIPTKWAASSSDADPSSALRAEAGQGDAD